MRCGGGGASCQQARGKLASMLITDLQRADKRIYIGLLRPPSDKGLTL